MTLREAAKQALEALEPEWWETGLDVEKKQAKAADALRAALAEPDQESNPIYLAEVTMPEPLPDGAGYILDDSSIGPWCAGAAWCLDCHHEWIAVWPLGAESLGCPSCGSMDTDREQSGPHKLKRREKE